MASGPAILLLTEDSGRNAHGVIQAVARELLLLVCPVVRLEKVRFEPATEDARFAMAGNKWRSNQRFQEYHRVRLCRSIATALGSDRFVFLHSDGDTVWSSQDQSITQQKFETIIRSKVLDLLRGSLQKSLPHDQAESSAARRARRLVLIAPYYSIESWLYQNTLVAIDICDREYGGKDREKFGAWEKSRADLDEVICPKKATVLRDQHNLELAANGYPCRIVFEVDKSLAAAARLVANTPDLIESLEATRSQ